MALCTISEVHLSDHVGPAVKHCMISESDALCELEYAIGAERGWLFNLLDGTGKGAEMAWANVDSEVIEHLERRTMALLPAPEVLERLFQLYEHNFDENLPAHKRDWFLDVLPFEEYAYTILPPALPQPVALHIKGSIYPPPFEGLPSIRSKLHPCFVLGPAGFYVAKFRSAFGFNPFDESTFIKVADAFAAGAGNPQKSWLGPREDEYKYSKRRRVIICNLDAPGTITPTSTPLKKTSLLDQANAGPV